ncbi:MAG: hypothetical protein AAF519_00170 [Bacteroidota bacterium]
MFRLSRNRNYVSTNIMGHNNSLLLKFYIKRVMRYFTLIVICLCCMTGFAQKKKKFKSEEIQSNSFEPYAPVEEKAEKRMVKKAKKSSYRAAYHKNLNQKVKDFEGRMKANAKEDRKLARKMRKPQYSDPSYFGHKRKPKKRPVGKRKFCKECSRVH